MPPTIEETSPIGAELGQTIAVETPSRAIEAEDKGYSKPTLAEDKGKGSAKIEEAKKAIEYDTHSVKGPLTKSLVAEGIESIMLQGR
jgi:hypothetical protein